MATDCDKLKTSKKGPRNKFRLTDLHREYISHFLPDFLVFRTTDHGEQKRNCFPKIIDPLFNDHNQGESENEKPRILNLHKKKTEKNSKAQHRGKIKSRKERLEENISHQQQSEQFNQREEQKLMSKKNLKKYSKHVNQKEKPKNAEEMMKNQPINEIDKIIDDVFGTPLDIEIQQSRCKSVQTLKKPEKKEKVIKKAKQKEKSSKRKNWISSRELNGLMPKKQHFEFSQVQKEQDEVDSIQSFQKNLKKTLTEHLQNDKKQISMSEKSMQNSFEKDFSKQMFHKQQMSAGQKKYCIKFLTKLKHHKSSWPFKLPVDPITQGVPNYLEIVHCPMDLKTIEKKLMKERYEHVAEFHGDVNKIFLNSYKFNPRETYYFQLTVQLQAYYYRLLARMPLSQFNENRQDSLVEENIEVFQDQGEKKKTNSLIRKKQKNEKMPGERQTLRRICDDESVMKSQVKEQCEVKEEYQYPDQNQNRNEKIEEIEEIEEKQQIQPNIQKIKIEDRPEQIHANEKENKEVMKEQKGHQNFKESKIFKESRIFSDERIFQEEEQVDVKNEDYFDIDDLLKPPNDDYDRSDNDLQKALSNDGAMKMEENGNSFPEKSEKSFKKVKKDPKKASQIRKSKKRIDEEEYQSNIKYYGQRKTFSREEKKKLISKIQKLRGEYLEQILIIIYGEEQMKHVDPSTAFEIGLNELPDETIRTLEKFVQEKEKENEKNDDQPTANLEKEVTNDLRINIF